VLAHVLGPIRIWDQARPVADGINVTQDGVCWVFEDGSADWEPLTLADCAAVLIVAAHRLRRRCSMVGRNETRGTFGRIIGGPTYRVPNGNLWRLDTRYHPPGGRRIVLRSPGG
jgi:hypothetical protein